LVDVDLFQPRDKEAQELRHRWSTDKAVLIGYFGSFWVINGLEDLIRSFSDLIACGYEAKLLIAGTALVDRQCDDIPELVRRRGVSGRVIQPGWLDTDDMLAAMTACDILVIPRLRHSVNSAGAPAPTKLAEYLAMGRPVVAADLDSSSAVLREGEEVLFYRPGDRQAMVEALKRVIGDEAERQRMSAAARQAAVREFDYRVVGSRLAAAVISASSRHGVQAP
jgi:glycosyltransferase involved in cell wall biosynthesis